MPKLQKIICALDLSEHSKTVAEYACMLAKAMNASIVAVYAAPTLTQYTGFHVPPNTIDSFVGEIVSGAEKAMAQFVSENFEGVETKAEVVVGYAAEEILEIAAKEEADLIVMGTHGRKGIDRILFGSVAERVVKNSHLPVLTIRPSDNYTGGAMYKD
ncbi:universal stress protein [uncultured Mailhella sp.]|uniref:universal stress protein n=1 Tax=uncultured Mailhella sp. TaxID=1981031 RepID=UPI0025EC88EC|nr:universal stress protein [uncultured Mailhella sp.]